MLSRITNQNDPAAALEEARQGLSRIDEQIFSRLKEDLDSELKRLKAAGKAHSDNLVSALSRGSEYITDKANDRIKQANKIIRCKIDVERSDQSHGNSVKPIQVIRIDQTKTVIGRAVKQINDAFNGVAENLRPVVEAATKMVKRLVERLIGENILEQKRILQIHPEFKEAEDQDLGLLKKEGLEWLANKQTILDYIDKKDDTHKLLVPLHKRRANIIKDLKLTVPVKQA